MVTQQVLFVFVVMCLIKPSVEECKMPTRTPQPASELIDPQFWKEYYEQTEKCVEGMQNKRKQRSPTVVGPVADLWGQYDKSPINDVINSVPCIKKNFDKIMRSSTMKRVRSALGVVPVVGGQIQNLWDVFTGGPGDNTEELKDEIWKANEAVLCALSMNTEKIREMLKDQTTHIDGMINNQTIEIKDFVNAIAENLKNAMTDFRSNMNERFDDLQADTAEIQAYLVKISAKLSRLPFKLSVFIPIDEVYAFYKLSIGKPSPNEYTVRCLSPTLGPLGALTRLQNELVNTAEMKDIMEPDQFSDETYDEFYKTIIKYVCDALELIFNCPDDKPYESKMADVDQILEGIETALDRITEHRKNWYYSAVNLQHLFFAKYGDDYELADMSLALRDNYKAMGFSHFVAVVPIDTPDTRCLTLEEECITFKRKQKSGYVYIMRTVYANNNIYSCRSYDFYDWTHTKRSFADDSKNDVYYDIMWMERHWCPGEHRSVFISYSPPQIDAGAGFHHVRMVRRDDVVDVVGAQIPKGNKTKSE